MQPKFIKLDFTRNSADLCKLAENKYLISAIELLYSNRHALFDDFLGLNEENRLTKGIALVSHFSPYFWAIIDQKTDELAGVVYLYSLVGTPKNLFSAYVSTCFKRKYWGKFVQKSTKKFMRYVFGKLKLHKLFAEIYEDNKLGVRAVKRFGFMPLVFHKEQTIRGKKPCNTWLFVKFKNKRGTN